MKNVISNPQNIKRAILKEIRKKLLENGSATKVELSEQLGFSFPTISKFISQMEKNGEVFSVGLDDSSGGRRAKRYSYNQEYMLGLAIFLEGTETNYTIFNCLGEQKEEGELPSVIKDGKLDSLTNCIENLVKKYPKISSIAIGVPGAVDRGRIFFIPAYEQLQNFDLKGYFEDYFSIPVVIENDMNAAVLGFNNHKMAKDNESLVYLYTGQNGPGAGIMINGDVVRGRTFFSGEVQFVPLYDQRNFGQVLVNGNGQIKKELEIDAVSRLIASFVATINPHIFIFSNNDVDQETLNKISERCSTYIPSEHLPEFTISDWKQDYLYGLQSLCLNAMINE